MSRSDPSFDAVVNVHQAKTHFSRLLERVLGGEEIVIAKAGKPCAKLVALATAPMPRRQFGQLKHLRGQIPSDIWFEPEYSDQELDEFEGKFGTL